MKMLLIVTGMMLAMSSARADDLARSVAERLLEDEEIWAAGDERLSDTDRAWFMRRADEAARAVAEGARSYAGNEQLRYIESALNGPEGLRRRLRDEIRECALTGERPTGAFEAPPSIASWRNLEAPDPKTLIILFVALSAIVPLLIVVFSRRGRSRRS